MTLDAPARDRPSDARSITLAQRGFLHVLEGLAGGAGGTLTGWKVEDIAAAAQASRSATQRFLRELERADAITRTPGGHHRPSTITLRNVR